MKNTNQTAKEKRGFTTEVENNFFISKSDIELISLLESIILITTYFINCKKNHFLYIIILIIFCN